jgi:hypothetical protein
VGGTAQYAELELSNSASNYENGLLDKELRVKHITGITDNDSYKQ